jgi:gag-polyprotein putative aspartyl protease
MRVFGKWLQCDDGETRPVVECLVSAADGRLVGEHFLVDSCADCTVLSADLLTRLKLVGKAPPQDMSLKGISGAGNYVVVNTIVELVRADAGPVRVRGEMAAFTDTTATDLSILGRDVLNQFDVILSRRRDEVVLLAGDHHYQIGSTNSGQST